MIGKCDAFPIHHNERIGRERLHLVDIHHHSACGCNQFVVARLGNLSHEIVPFQKEVVGKAISTRSHGTHRAPCEAEVASLAYFASTPVVYRGGNTLNSMRRSLSSSADTSRSMLPRAISMAIQSPSRTSASGPPGAAAGAAG